MLDRATEQRRLSDREMEAALTRARREIGMLRVEVGLLRLGLHAAHARRATREAVIDEVQKMKTLGVSEEGGR